MSNYGTFGENNPVWKAINRYADMLLTGVLFVITCLPVVTIGASLCAFYYTAMDSLRKEDGYIFKRYFSSFGKNFKKATILWLIMLAIAAVLGLDVYFWLVNSQVQFSGVMLGVSGILCFLWFMTFMFVFPLQTRFENSIGKTLQNAFMIALDSGGNDRIRKKIIPGSCGVTHPYHLPSALSAADRISACGC